MSQDYWKPHVTVAAVIERGGRYLLVEEETSDGVLFNQPAGHLEDGESLVDACAREVLEETRFRFRPTSLIGVYQWPRRQRDVTYLRFCFAGDLLEEIVEASLDSGIIAPCWMTVEEVRSCAHRHRSPLILQCIEDHAANRRYPLDLIRHYDC